MSIALLATLLFVPATPRPVATSSITEPLRALRHGDLARTSVTGLLYNWGFFTILGNVASAAYGFVRFIGGGLAPYAAGRLAERYDAHVPFLIAAAVVLAAAGVVVSMKGALDMADTFDHAASSSASGVEPEVEALSLVPGDPEEAILAEEVLEKRR
jgi:hypothetical protein